MISIKVILIGDGGVGKTCLIQQYTNKEFNEETVSTIAVSDKLTKEVKVGEKTIKFILLGDTLVGKTCLINQYINKNFLNNTVQTISGGDKLIKDLYLCNKTVKLEIWDIAGAECYRAINKRFMNKAKIAAIVYDITNQKSFDNIKNWYNELKDKNDTIEMIGIIANKSDLYEEQVVSKDEGENYANSIKGFFYETSAMDYESVSNAFEDLTKKYVEYIFYEEENKRKSIIK